MFHVLHRFIYGFYVVFLPRVARRVFHVLRQVFSNVETDLAPVSPGLPVAGDGMNGTSPQRTSAKIFEFEHSNINF